MTVWAVTMVKDEADVIAGTLAHMADEGVAGIIVADNGSTDGTRDIIDSLDLSCQLVVVDDPDPAYHQSEKMTALAGRAARCGATWIVPFDADEIWVAPHRVADVLEAMPCDIVTAQLYDHRPSAADPADPDPFRSIVWRERKPAGLPKVAFRWHPDAVIHQGNHGVTIPGSWTLPGLEVRHFPYRSADQFVRKAANGAAAYRAAPDLPEDMGLHWRQYGQLLDAHGPEVLADVFRQHFWRLSPFDAGMVRDPAPYLRWR